MYSAIYSKVCVSVIVSTGGVSLQLNRKWGPWGTQTPPQAPPTLPSHLGDEEGDQEDGVFMCGCVWRSKKPLRGKSWKGGWETCSFSQIHWGKHKCHQHEHKRNRFVTPHHEDQIDHLRLLQFGKGVSIAWAQQLSHNSFQFAFRWQARGESLAESWRYQNGRGEEWQGCVSALIPVWTLLSDYVCWNMCVCVASGYFEGFGLTLPLPIDLLWFEGLDWVHLCTQCHTHIQAHTQSSIF